MTDPGMAKDPEVGDFVKVQGQIRMIEEGEAFIEIYRGGSAWVQCGALEHVEVKEDDLPPRQCCDLHGRNCEPPSELCCEKCTEADHPAHRQLGPCSSPDLSPVPKEDVT